MGKNKINWKTLAVAVLLCQVAGIIGSFFTAPNISTWYASLNKPSFQPPNSVFAPVWISLYTCMGVSLYVIWNEKKTAKRDNALKWFYAQLALNAAWSIVFFGMKEIAAGLLILLLLTAVLAVTMIKFWKINENAAGPLVPYLLWCCLAAALNYSVWILN
ncbi:MAG: TspO/MBR family protein [archaeon]